MLKIGFIANLEHGQADVVFRCRDELRTTYGIELCLMDPDGSENLSKYDLILVHTDVPWEHLLESPIPLVLLERIDGPQLSGPVRRALARPNVRAVIKTSTYRRWELHNSGPWRKHEAICQPTETRWPTPEPITLEMAQKIKMAFSFAAYPHLEPLRRLEPVDLSKSRPYVAHFAGTVDYGDDPKIGWLSKHRRDAVAALAGAGIPGPKINFPERAMQFDSYFRTLTESQHVFSPFGLGEPCYRDFEAVLAGCCVVKPSMGYVVTIPYEFYEIPQISRFRVAADYSDAAAVLSTADPVSIGDRIQWASHVARENSTPRIAFRLSRIFKTALNPL